MTRGIVYYTDNRLDPLIANACQKQLLKANLPIVSVSLKPIDFGYNIVLDQKRSILTLFQQMLAGLNYIDTDYVFLAEHDVLYHPSHFDFIPERDDVNYYNINVWKVRVEDGHALWVDLCRMTSGLCAGRVLLIRQYYERVRRLEERDGHATSLNSSYLRRMGFEPGTHGRKEKVDSYGCENWKSKYPNLDLCHKHNLTHRRWKKSQWANKRWIRGWKESGEVPGWGTVKGNMNKILANV